MAPASTPSPASTGTSAWSTSSPSTTARRHRPSRSRRTQRVTRSIASSPRVRRRAQACQQRLRTAADGSLSLTVPPLGFVIYQATDPVPASPAAPADQHRRPRARPDRVARDDADGRPRRGPTHRGARRPRHRRDGRGHVRRSRGRRRLRADRHRRQRALYRVFYDASHLRGQDDVELSFRAIVNDLSGHLAADEVVDVGVEFPAPTATHDARTR